MDPCASDFYAHLQGYRLESGAAGAGASPSHTTFGRHLGSYRVPLVEQDAFLESYAREALLCGSSATREVCVVERHREFGPVVIDLDFRFDVPVSGLVARRHDAAAIDAFVAEYVAVLATWVELPPEGVDVFVMERAAPRVEKGLVKDGVHIVIPEAVTECRLQLLIRRQALAACGRALEGVGLRNAIEDVFDEGVILRGGWMMLGSAKPGLAPYDVSRVSRVTVGAGGGGGGGVRARRVPFAPPHDVAGFLALARRLSIRTRGEREALPVHLARQGEVERMRDIEGRARELRRTHPVLSPADTANASRASAGELDLARKLVRILSDHRAESFDEWMRVGWCLHNLDDRLLADWVAFSRRSAKFTEGFCEELWRSMVVRPDRALRIGSLRKWAREDSPRAYSELQREESVGHVRLALSGLHHDVATATYNLFMGDFVCSNVRNNQWYRFESPRWRSCDSGTTLRSLLSTRVCLLLKEEAVAAQRAADAAGGGSDHPQAIAAAKLARTADQLKTSSFKDAVMRELKDCFYREEFEAKLDSSTNLLGFENGIYDLEAREFRRGEPEDMITFSTRCNYIPYDRSDPEYEEIDRFFRQVQPDEAMRTYLLRFFASCLSGDLREHSFHIAQGVGSNSKSLTVDFLEKALGDYAVKLSVSFLTQRRGHSSGANPEVARLRGKRFACLQEPGNDEVLNVGLMKEMSGGDTIVARALYREPIEFRPQFHMVLTANNLPEIKSADGGTWRRIRLVPFSSKFVDEPNPARANEFKVDYDLPRRLPRLVPYFMSLLVELNHDYVVLGNVPPPEVSETTREYQRRSDHLQLFVEKHVVVDPDAVVDFGDLFAVYKEFLVGENNNCVPRKQEFIASVRNLVSIAMLSNDTGRGVRIRAEQKLLYEGALPPPTPGAAQTSADGASEEGAAASEEGAAASEEGGLSPPAPDAEQTEGEARASEEGGLSPPAPDAEQTEGEARASEEGGLSPPAPDAEQTEGEARASEEGGLSSSTSDAEQTEGEARASDGGDGYI